MAIKKKLRDIIPKVNAWVSRELGSREAKFSPSWWFHAGSDAYQRHLTNHYLKSGRLPYKNNKRSMPW